MFTRCRAVFPVVDESASVRSALSFLSCVFFHFLWRTATTARTFVLSVWKRSQVSFPRNDTDNRSISFFTSFFFLCFSLISVFIRICAIFFLTFWFSPMLSLGLAKTGISESFLHVSRNWRSFFSFSYLSTVFSNTRHCRSVSVPILSLIYVYNGFWDHILIIKPITRRFANNNAMVVKFLPIFRSHLLPWSRHVRNVINMCICF